MNKIQLTILWCMGIVLSIASIYTGLAWEGYLVPFSYKGLGSLFVEILIPVLIIGSLLIYTLRNHK